MKNIFYVIMAMLVSVACFCGCGETVTTEDNIDNALEEYYRYIITPMFEAPSIDEVSNITIESRTNDYIVKDKDITIPVPKLQSGKKISHGEEVLEVSKDDNIIQAALGNILRFIDDMSIIEDKDSVKSHIESVKFYKVKFDFDRGNEGELFALYDEPDHAVYISSDLSEEMYQEMGEYVITHELMHAVCSFTNGGDAKKRFCTGFWDEAQTEVFVANIPGIKKSAEYMLYDPLIAYTMYAIKPELMKAYFYGYDSFSEEDMRLLDVYARCAEALWDETLPEEQLYNQLLLLSRLTMKFAVTTTTTTTTTTTAN